MKIDSVNESRSLNPKLRWKSGPSASIVKRRESEDTSNMIVLRLEGVGKIRQSLSIILLENLPILMLFGIYICMGFAIQVVLDIPGTIRMKAVYVVLFCMGTLFSICFIIVQMLRGRTWKYFNYRSFGGFLITLLLMVPFETTFASIKQAIPDLHPFSWDANLMHIDYFLHFGHHPWELLNQVVANERLIRFLDNLYMLWFPLLFLFCFWMGWSSRRKLRLQFFISTLLVWMIFGSLLGTVFSSAGPCYFSMVEPELRDPYESLMRSLYIFDQSKPLWAIRNQLGIWDAMASDVWVPFGGISAMPSIHVAMAVLFALVAWKTNPGFGILSIAYAVVIQIGAVVLGWHYAVDGYASIIMTLLLWRIVGQSLERHWLVTGLGEMK